MKINNATPVVNTNIQTNNVNFKGVTPKKPAKEVLKEFLTLDRSGPMSRDLFVANAFAFLLGTRLVTSRDKDEKREILIRDIPTIVIAVVGVPVIRDAFAELIQKKSGFAFMQKGEKSGVIAKGADKLFKMLTKKEETKNVVSYGELGQWYQFDKNLSSGFKGFTERLSEQGGNLHKIFSSLGESARDKIKDFSKDNKEFMTKLFNNSEESKSLIKTFEDEFATEGNNALKHASWKRTMPALIGLGLTLGLIGIFIPKLNIFITETVNKNRKSNEQTSQSPKV